MALAKIYGMNFTGHGISGPGTDLLHLESAGVEEAVALEFHETFANHSSLSKGLAESFDAVQAMSGPGLARLASWQRESGALIYEVQQAISVRELTRAFRQLDKPVGERAGLEIMLAVANSLSSAAAKANEGDIPCHGFLSPWTIFITRDGSVTLIGYGVPAAPLYAFMDQHVDTLSPNALKYCPPERIENRGEDMSSDLHSLALVAAEIMTGEWVYDGKADEVLEQIIEGKAPDCFEEISEALSDATFELLSKALEPKLKDRFSEVDEFIAEARAALDEVTGPSLAEVYAQAEAQRVRDDLGFDTTVAEPEPEIIPTPSPAQTAPEAAPPAPTSVSPEPTPEPAPTIPTPQAPAPSAGAAQPLDAGATVEQIHERAREMATEAEGLASSLGELIEACAPQVSESPAVLGPILEGMESAARRASKAAKATRSSVSLVELDENAEDARMSLELVSSSLQQVQAAAAEAKEGEQAVLAHIRGMKAEAQAIEVAHQKADDCTATAHESWRQAIATLELFEADANSGILASPGIDEVLSGARAATEAARVATADATEAATNAGSASTAAEAQDAAAIAHAAAEASKQANTDASDAYAKAKKMAEKAKASVLEKLQGHTATCTEAHSRATQAEQRAKQALEVVPSGAASALAEQLVVHAAAAATAKETQANIVSSASAATLWSALLEAIRASNEQATNAQRASDEAAAACDQIIALAGEAAAAAAELSKAVDEARRIVERVQSLTDQEREELDRLNKDTEGITSARALRSRSDANDGVSKAERLLKQMRNQLGQVEGQNEAASARLIVDEMKDAASSAESSLKDARRDMRDAVEAAEVEMEALRKQRAHQAALDEAVNAAQKNRDQCKALVAAAWEAYNGAPQELRTTTIPRAIELRSTAHEIIDIADYQAKEADVAARQASEQTDPSEASSYANTARSFAERIEADLPEAHAALEEAIELATREVRQLAEARATTASALEQGAGLKTEIEELIREGELAAQPWSDAAAVSAALAKLKGCIEGFETDLEELTYARDRAAQVSESEKAQEVVPTSKTALQRAEAKRIAAEAAMKGLQSAISSAENEKAILQNVRQEVGALIERANSLLKTIMEAAQSLEAAIEAHSAVGVPVTEARQVLNTSKSDAGKGVQGLEAVRNSVNNATDGENAKSLLAKAKSLLQQIEGSRDKATEATAIGSAAAEREAQDRAAADERKLANAHETAKSVAEQAERTVAGLGEKLSSTQVELDTTSSAEAQSLRAKAKKAADVVEEQLEGILSDAAEIGRNEEPESAARDAQALSQRVSTLSALVAKANGFLDEAIDEARASAAEAEALGKIRAEGKSMVEQAGSELERARQAATEVSALIAEATTEATRALAPLTQEHIDAADKAKSKIHAALPMLDNADSVAVAQGILKTCRKALTRVQESANENEALVTRAKAALQQEREQAAQALAEARREAQAPAEQAAAAAVKAESWCEAGEQEAQGVTNESVVAALNALISAKDEVKALSRAAAETAIDANFAATVEDAAAVASKVTEAAQTALDAAKRTREALEGLRNALAAEKQAQAEIEVLQLEAAGHATEAEKVRSVVDTTLTQILGHFEKSEYSNEESIALREEAELAGRQVEEAVAESLEHTAATLQATSLDEAKERTEAARSAFERTVSLLEKVVELDAKSQDVLKRLVEEAENQAKLARERARQDRENARNAKLKEREAARQAATQAFPINRGGGGTDRKERFERAKAEREALRGRGDDLRQRLRASRGSSAGERPQRGGAAPILGERAVRPRGESRPSGAADRIRRSPRPAPQGGAAERRISRRPQAGSPRESASPEQPLSLPPDAQEDAATVAEPRRPVRRSHESQAERPSRRLERSSRPERITRSAPAPTVPAAPVPEPESAEPPKRSRNVDDLLARMKRRQDENK